MSTIPVEKVQDGFLVRKEAAEEDTRDFRAHVAGKDILVVHPVGGEDSSGYLNTDNFGVFLQSLAVEKWTGRVNVSFESSKKQIYFSKGEMVFAGSNQIDDRLGEVIYRRGMISLDDMMDAAVSVTKEQKFGQVCLDRGTFTNEGLWLGLRAQILSVLKSVFMGDFVCFSLEAGFKAPTEVAMWESTENLIMQCVSYGAMYRYFAKKLSLETQIRISEDWKINHKYGKGTFISDLCQLCEEKVNYSEIEAASKLLSENTIAELLNLYIEGALDLASASVVSLPTKLPHLSKLKNTIEAYELVVSTVQKIYKSLNKDLPVAVCKEVISKLDSKICPSIDIDNLLSITPSSLELIMSQCVSSERRTKIMEKNIRGLMQFVVLAAGDSLPYEHATEVKKFYKMMIQ